MFNYFVEGRGAEVARELRASLALFFVFETDKVYCHSIVEVGWREVKKHTFNEERSR